MAFRHSLALASAAAILLAAVPAASAEETRVYAYCDKVASPGDRDCGASAHSHTRNCRPLLGPVGYCLDASGGNLGAGVLVQGADPCPRPEQGDYCWGWSVKADPENEPRGCHGTRYTATLEWWVGDDPWASRCIDSRIMVAGGLLEELVGVGG